MIDERPAVAAARVARDPEHQRWLITVATAIDAPPYPPTGTLITLTGLLLALVAAAALAG